MTGEQFLNSIRALDCEITALDNERVRMTESGFWNDDAQVVQEIIEKFWWDTPGIYICIRSLAKNDNS